ncbi:hypothetical protein F511_15664 [Dorcoceras hygrometricum]|uniref:Uncharacterized protein n=1 Tax=Dorcoceras hygrometricum TaxID=472368 RepID=A0A2Z7AAD6_9LAMI|nr:hypothetical protein F511_15664 [Dorcoceras hygrometricum]
MLLSEAPLLKTKKWLSVGRYKGIYTRHPIDLGYREISTDQASSLSRTAQHASPIQLGWSGQLFYPDQTGHLSSYHAPRSGQNSSELIYCSSLASSTHNHLSVSDISLSWFQPTSTQKSPELLPSKLVSPKPAQNKSVQPARAQTQITLRFSKLVTQPKLSRKLVKYFLKEFLNSRARILTIFDPNTTKYCKLEERSSPYNVFTFSIWIEEEELYSRRPRLHSMGKEDGKKGRPAPTSFTGKPALQTVGGGRLRLIKSTTGSKVPSSACTRRPDEISTDGNSSSRWPEQVWRGKAAAAAAARGKHGGGVRLGEEGGGREPVVGPQPLWLRNHNSGPAQRIMVKRLATSPHDPLGITDSACKNQSVVVSVQYGPFNPYIPIRSTTIGKSRVAIDPIAMHTSWRSNSDIASVTSIGYPRMSASGESSTTMHRLLHASGSHPIPTPYDPNTTKTSDLSTLQMVTTWKVRTRVVR